MPAIPFDRVHPKVGAGSWIAPDAWVIGQATIGENVAVFFGTTVRGDVNPIVVGNGTNLQEGALLHTSTGLGPCIVGADVTVGHHAIIHGCTIKDRCIIGMGATILDGAEIGEDSIVGANSLVTMNQKFPPRSMIFGSPAKAVRQLTPQEVQGILESAHHYQELCRQYGKHFEVA